ncbi:hypothetical protein B0H16DRAFT_1518143 [Mycena metata]|uniref:F-box domain-containing protein n=1 Tax=Mycena metata TaxID=1033252 RepID=A0AAD7JQ48_9AGAR|nr:hypothetical protein B0H16DRAFT_1518143 [Mycena metata]
MLHVPIEITILHLPNELLTNIGGNLHWFQLRNMRLSCKTLCDAMDPIFHKCFILNGSAVVLKLPESLRLFEDMAKGRSKWPQYAKEVVVRTGSKTLEKQIYSSWVGPFQYTELLEMALRSMKNICTVSWRVSNKDVPWICEALQRTLPFIPLLAKLNISIDIQSRNAEVCIAGVSGLKHLKINDWGQRCPLGPQVSDIVAQSPELTSLHLPGHRSYSVVWPIFNSAISKSVRLTQLTTHTVATELLTYLASYSGLEMLALNGVDAGNRQASDELAYCFFTTVLPHHAETLVNLSCTAGYESNWSFGTHNVASLLSLHRLQRLRVSVNAADVFDPINRTQRKRNIKTIDNNVHLLLRSVHHLPSLECVSITYGAAQGNRNARCGNPRQTHAKLMEEGIQISVEAFKTEVPSALQVWAPGGIYHQVNIFDEQVCAESTGSHRQIFAYRHPASPNSGISPPTLIDC